MNTYVLLMAIFMNGNSVAFQQTFNTQSACQEALSYFEAQRDKYKKVAGYVTVGKCFSVGGGK